MGDRAVRLDPMSQQEFDAYLVRAVPEYAAAKVGAGTWAREGAEGMSQAAFASLLPLGLETPGHYLYTVRDAASGEPVAILYLAERPRGGRSAVYVYDIKVGAEHRGRGYGRATMNAALERARDLGAAEINLHVLGSNTTARQLYRSLGFVETDVDMSLSL
ncbi:MAG TPA: GNAT family N-acetyltransferase [Actinocrinis sp.]|jgi:ribosomal protein S18 acetylase RimI-like enzyme